MKTIYSYCTGMVDFPDKFALTIYFSGCNLNCHFCHNKHVLNEESNYSLKDVVDEIHTLKQIVPNMGIVLSGGEPTVNADFENALKRFRDFPLSLHTNGLTPVPEFEGNITVGLKPFTDYAYIERLHYFLDAHTDVTETYHREVRYVKGVSDKKYQDVIETLSESINHNNWKLIGVNDSRKAS